MVVPSIMRQGLIANWNRRMASKGLLGAVLLLVPVVIAATIGFGGAAGLSSLATGPSESSIGATAPIAQQRDHGIDDLLLDTLAGGHAPGESTPGQASLGSGGERDSGPGAPLDPGSGGGGGGGAPGGSPGGSGTPDAPADPGAPQTPDPTVIGVNLSDMIGDGTPQNPGLLGGLLGQGQGQGQQPGGQADSGAE